MSARPAETLRDAAVALREYAAAVNAPTIATFAAAGLAANAANHAAMYPPVALALAGWLEREAQLWDAVETVKTEYGPKGLKVTAPLSTHAEALAVARALLGEEAPR